MAGCHYAEQMTNFFILILVVTAKVGTSRTIGSMLTSISFLPAFRKLVDMVFVSHGKVDTSITNTRQLFF